MSKIELIVNSLEQKVQRVLHKMTELKKRQCNFKRRITQSKCFMFKANANTEAV